MVILESRFHHIKALLARLRLDSSARLVVLVDKDGRLVGALDRADILRGLIQE